MSVYINDMQCYHITRLFCFQSEWGWRVEQKVAKCGDNKKISKFFLRGTFEEFRYWICRTLEHCLMAHKYDNDKWLHSGNDFCHYVK